MAKGKMNGSTELLAKAMRSVFTEAVEGGVEPLRKDVKRLEEGLETTNKNIQAQLAQNRKDISSDVRRITEKTLGDAFSSAQLGDAVFAT